MTWLSPGTLAPAGQEHPEPRHLPHLNEQLHSPVHHLAGHGPMHDLRQHVADAVQLGDLDAIHRHIALAEAQHLVPPHWGEMLNFLWGPGPNTHEHRLGMSSAINTALELAKTYNNILQLLQYARTVPPGPERDRLISAGPSFIEAMAKSVSEMPPGTRRSMCEATIERLQSATEAASA